MYLKIDRAQVFSLQRHEKTCECTEKIGLVYTSIWFLLALVQLHCCWKQDRIFKYAWAFKERRSCMVLCTYLIGISGKDWLIVTAWNRGNTFSYILILLSRDSPTYLSAATVAKIVFHHLSLPEVQLHATPECHKRHLKAFSPAFLTNPPPSFHAPAHAQCFRDGCLFFMGPQD